MLFHFIALFIAALVPSVPALLRGQGGWDLSAASNSSIQEGQLCIAKAVGGDDILTDKDISKKYALGLKSMATKGVIMAGLVRNVRWTIRRVIRELQATGNMFMRHHTILLESGSTDGKTKPLLRELCQGALSPSETTCLILDAPPQIDSLPRIARLTHWRQQLLDSIRSFSSRSPAHWDYVLMFDGDIFEGPNGQKEDRFGFSSAVLPLVASRTMPDNTDTQFGLVCANSIRTADHTLGRYRDTFALRETSWDEKRTQHQRRDPIHRLYKGSEPVNVLSCFSGLALYSGSALLSSACNYTYMSEDVCEHVALNRCLSEQHGFGKAAIHPSWSVIFDNPVPHVCMPPPL